MCLMLYIATAEALPLMSLRDLRVEAVDDVRSGVAQWFSLPSVRFVGSHTGCSCGFPSVTADSVIEYYDGMPLQSDDRAADLRSVRSLLDLLRRAATTTERIELYPVTDGDEAMPPKGIVGWPLSALDADRFFFNERFLHIIHAADMPPARN
jgi:hypothetical protein